MDALLDGSIGWAVVFLAVGTCLLVGGADVLVRGAVGVSTAAGLSRRFVGLTVVAWGTSAPDLAASAGAAAAGESDLALGTIVGSNVFNVLFILGLAAVVLPLTVASGMVRRDVPVMIGVSLLAWAMAFDGQIGAIDGSVLLAGLLAYTAWAYLAGGSGDDPAVGAASGASSIGPSNRAEPDAATPPRARRAGALAVQLSLIAGGLALLVGGSRLLVAGATSIAAGFGVPELVIGLTVVAGGTSLPEVATSLAAALRGERDLAVSNVVGSNLFNLLGGLGASALVAPAALPVGEAVLWLDLPVMVAAAVVCLPVFFTGGMITRWEGAALLAGQAAYTVYVVLDALDHAAFPAYRVAVLFFVVPLSLLTAAVVGTQAWARGSATVAAAAAADESRDPGETRVAAAAD